MKIATSLLFVTFLLHLTCLSSGISDTAGLIFKTFYGACNSYIIGKGNEVVIIDAGAKAETMLDYIKKENLTVKYIILTHGHDDHFNELPKLKNKLPSAKIVIHQKDNGSLRLIKIKQADILLKGNEVLEAGSLKLEIIHTPGHTGGGICIKAGNVIFTGDTLFKETVGSSDSWSGNFDVLINSIKTKLMALDDKLVIYPGHGTRSTIGHERVNNPFLK